MCFEIDEERIGTRGRTVQTIVEHAIRKEGAEVVVARIEFLVQVAHHRIELSGELLRVGQRGVHAIHRLLHIHLRQIARKLFGIRSRAMQRGHQLRNVARHQTIELSRCRFQVLADGRRVGQRLLQRGIPREAVEIRENAVEFGQHALHIGQHLAGVAHQRGSCRTGNRIEGGQVVHGIRTEQEVHRHPAHQRFDQLTARATGHTHVLVQLNAHHHAAVVVVVVLDVAHRAHGIAVGKHLARNRQALGVLETNVVRIARLEHIDALQEVDTQEEEYTGCNRSKRNFNLVGDFHKEK